MKKCQVGFMAPSRNRVLNCVFNRRVSRVGVGAGLVEGLVAVSRTWLGVGLVAVCRAWLGVGLVAVCCAWLGAGLVAVRCAWLSTGLGAVRRAGLGALVTSLLALGLAGLPGCSNTNGALNGEEAIDYKSVKEQSVAPLSIPPDLTQATNDPRYRASVTGTTTYSQYEQDQKQVAVVTQAHANMVLPQRADMHIGREGNTRWLVVELPPEEVFAKVGDFWRTQGFTIQVNDPAAGLIETDWAENRAKIPDSWIRRTLGRLLDRVYDSGEREKFRTRMERVDDHTEIFISHQHLVEKNARAPDSANLRWELGPEDPGLNAAMLARLMAYLGDRLDASKQPVKKGQVSEQEQASGKGKLSGKGQASGKGQLSEQGQLPGKEQPSGQAQLPGAKSSGRSPSTASTEISSPSATVTEASSSSAARTLHLQGTTLTLAEPFDRAWRRVGIALTAGEFTVDDWDRSAGDYFVRYVDTDTGFKQEEPNFFSRLFGKKKLKQTTQYRLHVAGQGDSSQITVRNANGVVQTSPTAQRLLSVLTDKMREDTP